MNIDSLVETKRCDAAKATLKNTIDYLAEQYANQIKSALIDANLPPMFLWKDEKRYKRKNILSRTIDRNDWSGECSKFHITLHEFEREQNIDIRGQVVVRIR